MNKNNKLILPITILVASVIVGGFIYASQISKQKSIEKQQQTEIYSKQLELDAKKEADTKIESAKNNETLQKSLCASEAEKMAVDLNKERCNRGEYCIKGDGMYSTGQYDNAYNVCLQRKGLK